MGQFSFLRLICLLFNRGQISSFFHLICILFKSGQFFTYNLFKFQIQETFYFTRSLKISKKVFLSRELPNLGYDVTCGQFHQHFANELYVQKSFWQLFLLTCN